MAQQNPQIPAFDDRIVETIAALLTNIVSQNEGVVISPRQGLPHAVFGSPWMYEWAKISEYLDRLKEWIVCGPESFVVATCLIKRLEASHAIPPLTQRTAHRVFLTALLLAVKMMEDETLTNSDFAKVGCVTTKQLNTMESYALRSLKFNCCVSAEEFAECINELNFAKQSIHTSNLKAASRSKARKERDQQLREKEKQREQEKQQRELELQKEKEKELQLLKEKEVVKPTVQASSRKMSIFSLRLKPSSKAVVTEIEPAGKQGPSPTLPNGVRRTASVDAEATVPVKTASVFASNRRKSCAPEANALSVNVVPERSASKTRATPRLLLRQDSI